MKIAVLLKMVPDLVEELEVDASGKALDTEELKFKLNEFDDHALEEALLLTSEGDEVVAFALDGDGVEKLLFTALAKGASRGVKLTGTQSHGSGGQAAAFGATLWLEMKRLFFDSVLAYNSKVLQDGVKGCYPSKFHDSELRKFAS